jgi:hypothetical protein
MQRVGNRIVAAEGLETRLVFGAGAALIDVASAGRNTSITFEQIQNLPSRLTYHNITATTRFSGQGLVANQQPDGDWVILGTVEAIENIQVTSQFTPDALPGVINLIARTPLTVRGIDSPFAVGTIRMDNANVAGEVDVAGLTNLRIGDASGSTFFFRQAQPPGVMRPLVFRAGNVVDSQFVFDLPVRSFTADAVASNTDGASTVQAPYVDSIKVRNGLNFDLTATGASPRTNFGVGKVSAGGINGGTWDVSGGGIGSVNTSLVANWVATVNGDVGQFNVRQDYTMSALGARSLRSFNVAGNMTAGGVILNLPFSPTGFNLGRFNVRGDVNNSLIQSDGNIRSISARTMSGTTVFVGINPAAKPAALPQVTDIVSAAGINSLRLGRVNGAPSFNNSFLAAGDFMRVDLGAVVPATGGEPFGLTANLIGQLQLELNGRRLRFRRLMAAENVESQFQSQNVTPQDRGNFQIRIPTF